MLNNLNEVERLPNFQQLGIDEQRVRKLKEQGIAVPTPVQQESIPRCRKERTLSPGQRPAQVKRWLSCADSAKRSILSGRTRRRSLLRRHGNWHCRLRKKPKLTAGEPDGIKILAVYGGQDVEKQSRKLEGGRHLIIGTPGRLLDHLRRGTLELGGVKQLVLDEADQMSHMGFLDEVEALMHALPYRRQTMLFSATMPAGVKRLAGNYMKDPVDIVIKGLPRFRWSRSSRLWSSVQTVPSRMPCAR